MPSDRDHILDWAEQGLIADRGLRDALTVAQALPGPQHWRRFLDRLLLWLGVVSLGAGVIFFFAYNWDALGRFGKLALAQLPILACLLAIWRAGLDSPTGKAAVLLASLLVGALIALIGQIYQTGADTYQLFVAWAGAILPWTLLARLPALWLLWLVLVHVALALYLRHFGLDWGWPGLDEPSLLPHALIDLAALIAWELAGARGVRGFDRPWGPRVIATAAGAALTWMALLWIYGFGASTGAAALWLLWLLASAAVYLRWRRDLYMLAVLALAVIVAVVTALISWVFDAVLDSPGGLMLAGLVGIGMSAVAAVWLRRLANAEIQA